MSVRKRTWTSPKTGKVQEKWMIQIDYTHPDGRTERVRRVSPVATRKGAEQYERQIREALLAGTWGKEDSEKKEVEEKKESTPTLKAFAPEFLEFQASPAAHPTKGANRKGEIVEKDRILRLHLIPAFGSQRLDKISARDIDKYTAKKNASGLSAGTVTNHLIVLKRLLNVAKRWELIDRVPIIPTPKKPNRVVFLDFEESVNLMKQTPLTWKPFILLALRSGLRLGELRGLRWENVDLEKRSIWVIDSFGKGGLGDTKNGKGRKVPLARDAADLLRTIYPRKKKATGLVFAQEDGSPLAHSSIHRVLDKAARAAGIQKPHKRKEAKHSGITPHVLRHTFASQAVMRNVPIRQVQEWMGHADITQTMRYSHLAPEGQGELVDRLIPE